MLWQHIHRTSDAIELHADAKSKRERPAALKEKLLDLLALMDHLLLQEGPQIESEYWSPFGPLEKRAQECCVLCPRLRRKRELMMASLQRGEELNLEAIEFQLDMEFKVYLEEIDDLERRYREALDRLDQMTYLSAEDSKHMKKLYRDFVKMMHPDLHGELKEDEKELWLGVQRAYEKGDLEYVELLYLSFNRAPESKDDEAYYEEQISFIKEKIKTILLQPPMSLQVFLKEDEKRERIAHLEDLIAQYSETLSKVVEDEIALLSKKSGVLH